jgi:hypothetical protein
MGFRSAEPVVGLRRVESVACSAGQAATDEVARVVRTKSITESFFIISLLLLA